MQGQVLQVLLLRVQVLLLQVLQVLLLRVQVLLLQVQG